MKRLLLAPLAALLLGAGCMPGNNGDAAEYNTYIATMGTPELVSSSGTPLTGDPAFDPASLSGTAAQWYQTLWESIEDPEQQKYFEDLAASDNLYNYGRLVQTHIDSLLLAFRYSGDMRLLDRVSVLTGLMRDELHDSWRGVAEGNERDGRDGYLNWVWRQDTSDVHLGKDLHEVDEMRTHALVAEVAWAFRANQEIASPGGVDYGEQADFWERYLKEHFEAKWRERNEIRWPRFPFLGRPYVHPTLAFVKYHYYMYRLTGDPLYLDEAKRLSDVLFESWRTVDTENGPAFVWERSITALGGEERYLMPTDYSSLVIADSLSLHLEGFYGWANAEIPEGLATMVAEFLIDDGANSFARDIGGGERRAGIRPSSASDWERVTPSEYAINTYAFLSAWDETGEIASVSETVYRNLPDQHHYSYIPAGLFVNAIRGEVEESGLRASGADDPLRLEGSDYPSLEPVEDVPGSGAGAEGQED